MYIYKAYIRISILTFLKTLKLTMCQERVHQLSKCLSFKYKRWLDCTIFKWSLSVFCSMVAANNM